MYYICLLMWNKFLLLNLSLLEDPEDQEDLDHPEHTQLNTQTHDFWLISVSRSSRWHISSIDHDVFKVKWWKSIWFKIKTQFLPFLQVVRSLRLFQSFPRDPDNTENKSWLNTHTHTHTCIPSVRFWSAFKQELKKCIIQDVTICL